MSEPNQLAQARALLAGGATGRALALLRMLADESPGDAAVQETLAEALAAAGDRAGAEAALRRVLALDPRAIRAATRLAGLIAPRRGAAEAADLLSGLADHPDADVAFFTALGQALKTTGRKSEAVEAYGRAAELAPGDAAVHHNLAGALGDAQRFSESEAQIGQAFAMGLDAPEAWLVHGRSLMGLGKLDEAEHAFREAIRRRGDYGDAQSELAQLIWMRTGELEAAMAAIDLALERDRASIPLALAKARVLEYAGEQEGAYEALARPLGSRPHDLGLQFSAAQLALPLDAELGLSHAERAYALAPDTGPAASILCQAYLAVGRAEEAARLAEGLMRDWPLDQHPVTLAATAWRILGDERYRRLYDYDRLVVASQIETPPGWSSLDAFLGDLAGRLMALHQMRAHPIGQSLRNGVQTVQSLEFSEDPVIQAFVAALGPPIRTYIDKLGGTDDLLGRRVTRDWRFSGLWSVLLRPGGRHVDHIHPQGWISSAFHIELPDAIETDEQGWLRFGGPGLPTFPTLAHEHAVKPRAGSLVLFPSYMWHGTAPFAGDKPRLAAAFDVIPA